MLYRHPIKELKRTIVETHDDGTQVSKLPDAETMMNKINEIVRRTNELEERTARIREPVFGMRSE